MARVLAFDESSDVSAAGDSPPPPPPAQRPPAAQERAGATSRPLKRVARFLGGDASSSDDGDANGYSAAAYGSDARRGLAMGQKRRTTAQDVDRMFADLDDEDDGLPPPLQRDRLDGTQNSMIDDTINAFGNTKGKGKGRAYGFFDQDGDDGEEDATNDKIDAEKAKKPKRKPVIMNEERLLGDRGIRRLKDNLKGFKIKGKGHEEDDLRRLMNVYQLWAHQMFPAGSFKDTISQVEKLCKKRSVKSLLKEWRDEAQGRLPPPLARGGDSGDDAEEGPTRHANSDDDDETEVLAHNRRGNASTTTSQAGSPDRGRPKKSYFDDIPTSSPGGALSRDPDMEEDEDLDLAESLFGSRAPASTAGPSTSRTAQPENNARMPTSEVGFQDADLTFDLEEDEFDMDEEAEAAMREMDAMNDDFFNAGPSTKATIQDKGKETNRDHTRSKSSVSTDPAMSFYADPKASEKRIRDGKSLVQDNNRQLPSSSPAPRRHEMEIEEDNFDDFDFGNEEEDIAREMEMAEKKQRDREAAAIAAERRAAEAASTAKSSTSAMTSGTVTITSSSKTPSLTTSSSAQDVDLELDDTFDDDFLQSVEESEHLTASQKIPTASQAITSTELASPNKGTSPLKTPVTTGAGPKVLVVDDEAPPLCEDEEEDLHS